MRSETYRFQLIFPRRHCAVCILAILLFTPMYVHASDPDFANAIVKIQVNRINKNFYQGSGFIISPCHVMTARHVILDDAGEISRTVKVTTRDGEQTSASVVAYGAPFLNESVRKGKYDRISEDFALLRTQSCVGRKTGPLPIRWLSRNNRKGNELRIAGFPVNNTEIRILTITRCSYEGIYENKIDGKIIDSSLSMTNCHTKKGQSGGPVLFIDHGHVVAVGVVSTTIGRRNIAADLRSIYPKIRSFIEKDSEN